MFTAEKGMIGHQPVQVLERLSSGLPVRGDFVWKRLGVVRRRVEQQRRQAEQLRRLTGITATIRNRLDREPDRQADAPHVGHAPRGRLAEFDAGVVRGPDTLGSAVVNAPNPLGLPEQRDRDAPGPRA